MFSPTDSLLTDLHDIDNYKYYKSSDEEQEDDEYDEDGNYAGVYGTRRKQKAANKDSQIYGNVWDNNDEDGGRAQRRGNFSLRTTTAYNHNPNFYNLIGLGRKAEPKYTTGLNFVKKETIVNTADKETMVKAGIKSTPKPEVVEEAERKAKFKKLQNQAPVNFGKGGSKQAADEAQDGRRLKHEEQKYQRYGKGFKMMKMMGFTADQHIEIVHAVKREEGQGLGVKKERPISNKKVKWDDQRDGAKSKQNNEQKSTQPKQPPKPQDKDFLQFLMKTSKETAGIKTERRKQQDDDFTANNLLNKQRMFKDMKIIDETGGQAEALFLKNQNYGSIPGNSLAPLVDKFSRIRLNGYIIDTSMEDMRKGFLTADRVESKPVLTRRGRVLQKYNNQKELMKSQLLSCVNKKSYCDSLLVAMTKELETLNEAIQQDESSIQQLREYHESVKKIVSDAKDSNTLIDTFKKLYSTVRRNLEEGKRASRH